jgi:hypothetical protein
MVTNPSAHHGENEAKDFRKNLIPLFASNGKVELVLAGHNHGYQQCSDDKTGIEFVTAGTGGRDPYKWGSKMDDHCRNNISGTDGYLEVEVINNTMTGQFVNLNGKSNENTIFQVSSK